MKHPGRKFGKGNYQLQVSSVLGYSSKTVGLTYRDWLHEHKISVAHAGANRSPKCQRIPKSKRVLLAVRALVRERQAKSERVVARHILDLMHRRRWLTFDESACEGHSTGTAATWHRCRTGGPHIRISWATSSMV